MRFHFLSLITASILLRACTTQRVNPTQTTNTTLESPSIRESATQVLSPPVIAQTFTATPKPPLAKAAWRQMPAVPDSIGDQMRVLYQNGIEMGNDPNTSRSLAIAKMLPLTFFIFMTILENIVSVSSMLICNQQLITIKAPSRKSLAVKGGFNVAAILSPLRTDPKACNKNESPAVPIIATKADNLEGDNSINATVAQIAYDYGIPLWNFWAAVQPLPNHGLWGMDST